MELFYEKMNYRLNFDIMVWNTAQSQEQHTKPKKGLSMKDINNQVNEAYLMACSTVTEPMIKVA